MHQNERCTTISIEITCMHICWYIMETLLRCLSIKYNSKCITIDWICTSSTYHTLTVQSCASWRCGGMTMLSKREGISNNRHSIMVVAFEKCILRLWQKVLWTGHSFVKEEVDRWYWLTDGRLSLTNKTHWKLHYICTFCSAFIGYTISVWSVCSICPLLKPVLPPPHPTPPQQAGRQTGVEACQSCQINSDSCTPRAKLRGTCAIYSFHSVQLQTVPPPPLSLSPPVLRCLSLSLSLSLPVPLSQYPLPLSLSLPQPSFSLSRPSSKMNRSF